MFLPPLFMIVLRQKYPRWWFDVKWLLAIPHHVVLVFLWICVMFATIGAWFAILFTGRYPSGLFKFIEGVIRWHNRVVSYTSWMPITLPTHGPSNRRCRDQR